MRAGFYGAYTTRSLARGGQRTLLALFCITVGVMAVVGLQLVSEMVRQALSGDVRALNQGDIAVLSPSVPLQQADLAFFDRLKSDGTITGYTPESLGGGLTPSNKGGLRFLSIRVVDPATFPLVGGPALQRSSGGSLRALLEQRGNAVVTRTLADGLHPKLGERFRIFGMPLQGELKLAGVVANDNSTASGDQVLVSFETAAQGNTGPMHIDLVGMTVADGAHRDRAVAALQQQFPLANVRTTDDLLRQNNSQVNAIRQFLDGVGLLALLIGGVGIVHTMQVLLSRRRVEIAMLKTAGYRRRDLYLLFGLEAALLGLAGGVLGALLGIGVAAGVRTLFARAFRLTLPLAISPTTVAGGALIGLATALIFGLMPIVRAAGVRPQAVLRDLPEGRLIGSWLQTAGLILLLSLLFFFLAGIVLGSFVRAAIAVYGAFLLLGLLSLGLAAILWVFGRLPVPERYSVKYVLLVTGALVVALGVVSVAPLRGVGLLMLAFVLAGYLVVLLPRPWKVSMKMALRNIGRTKARTTTTLLALFIGIFTVGLVLVFGQDLQNTVKNAFTSQLQFNLVAFAPLQSAPAVDAEVPKLPGLRRYHVNDIASGQPTTINGQPLTSRLVPGQTGEESPSQRQVRLLNGIQGYDLAKGDRPESIKITAGRGLEPGDAASANVLLNDELRKPPLQLGVGDTITLKDAQGSQTLDIKVAGFYSPDTRTLNFNPAPIYGSRSSASALAGSHLVKFYSLQVLDAQVKKATNQLADAAPAAIVLNLGDLFGQFAQIINNVLLTIGAIASLALLAGVIIVANAVALATLERRRELGILKAVGYTSGRVLTTLLLENALTAGLGGMLGMTLVALAIEVFNHQASLHFGVGVPITLFLIGGIVALTTVIALAVAWRAVRVRPLEVLRYE